MRAQLRHRPGRLAALTATSGLIAASALVLGSAPAFADETPPPAESAPVETAPVETTPTGPAPVESAPADPAPTDGGSPSPETASVPAAAPATITLDTPTVVQYGDNIDFDVTVTDANGDPAEGTVQITIQGGETFFGPIALVEGHMTLPFAGQTSDGPAYYWWSGDLEWAAAFTPADPDVVAAANASTTITIDPRTTMTTLQTSALAYVGKPYFAAVAIDRSESPHGAFPLEQVEGTVDLYANGQLVGSGHVSLGYIVLFVTPTTAGPVDLTATYRGSELYAASTTEVTTLNVVVPPADDTTSSPASLAETGGEPQSLAGTALAVLLGGGALSAVAARLRRRRS